jgi:hypothetical protein
MAGKWQNRRATETLVCSCGYAVLGGIYRFSTREDRDSIWEEWRQSGEEYKGAKEFELPGGSIGKLTQASIERSNEYPEFVFKILI